MSQASGRPGRPLKCQNAQQIHGGNESKRRQRHCGNRILLLRIRRLRPFGRRRRIGIKVSGLFLRSHRRQFLGRQKIRRRRHRHGAGRRAGLCPNPQTLCSQLSSRSGARFRALCVSGESRARFQRRLDDALHRHSVHRGPPAL